MNLSLDERKRLIMEAESVRIEYEKLLGDQPATRKRRLKLRNRYEEIGRLLGKTAAQSEFGTSQTTPQTILPSSPNAQISSTIKCPYCAETIQAEAKKCRFCGEWLTPSTDVRRTQHQSNFLRFAGNIIRARRAIGEGKAQFSVIRIGVLTIAGLLLLLIIGLCIGTFDGLISEGMRYAPTNRGPAIDQRSILPFTSPQILSLSEFNRVENGMSYDQVVRIIGKPGTVSSSNRMEGVPGVMPSIDTIAYSWQNSDGSNALIMFQNDRMMMKSQFGLR